MDVREVYAGLIATLGELGTQYVVGAVALVGIALPVFAVWWGTSRLILLFRWIAFVRGVNRGEY